MNHPAAGPAGPHGVVFDLDGTLLDSWQVHEHCLREAVHQVTGSPPGRVGLWRAQRPTDLATLGELVGADRAEQALLAYHTFLTRELTIRHVLPMPGVEAALAGLRARGIPVGVCTGRSREDAQALLKAARLDIPLLVARQDAPPKPAPDALLLALRRLGPAHHDVLFVGDSEWDRSQGRAAGVRTLIVGRAGLPDELAAASWPAGTHPAAAAVSSSAPNPHWESDMEISTGNSRPADAPAGEGPIAVLDLAQAHDPAGRARLATRIREVCEDLGAFLVVGHGIPDQVVTGVRDATAALFGGPERFAAELAVDPDDPLQRGLVAGRIEPLLAFTVNSLGESGRAARLPEDVPAALTAPNKWPRIPGFATAYRAYLAEVRRLADQLMELFALSLDLPEDWFRSGFTPDMSGLSANWYPAPAPGGTSGLLKLAHRDWSSLTVLHRDQAATGLQVLDRDGAWHEVPLVPGAFVINVGDLMAHWTGGRWHSAVHRVAGPPAGHPAGDRFSLAYFHQPGPATIVTPLAGPGDPVAGHAYRRVRVDDYFAAKRRLARAYERLVASSDRRRP
ncbi:HAD-IA family hydrolase [Kitasatospora sp. NPDC001527]|uniref:HAD-IA family hydrolase n=1 Tax=Kitasatospora sp. NPDC001527 TaxID=3154519 RepID=UPI003332D577